jgi:tRNA (guanine-N7-)-methyltransferase
MSRKKQHRFEHNTQAENVIERGKPLYTSIKGNWASFFGNDNPIVLELACGKGEYTVGLGQEFPTINFIGIDIKGDRIARGSKKAMEADLKNVCFLRTGIQYLDEFFNPNEISEIYLIHPDPQPRDKEEKKRLTNLYFLNLYLKYLKNDGIFHLKTDSDFLYEYTLPIVMAHPSFDVQASTNNLYASELNREHYGIKTYYEEYFTKRGHSISYIKAKAVK